MLTKELVKAARDIADQSSNPEGGITIQKCEEILSQVFVGQTRILEGFRHLVEAGDPSQDDHHSLQESLSFMDKVKVSSISDEDYEDSLVTISESMAKKITDQETYLKVKRAMRQMKIIVQIIAWMVTKKQVGASSAAASPSFPAASKPQARGRAAARGYQSLQMMVFSLS